MNLIEGKLPSNIPPNNFKSCDHTKENAFSSLKIEKNLGELVNLQKFIQSLSELKKNIKFRNRSRIERIRIKEERT